MIKVPAMDIITAEGLKKSYNGFTAVDGISFSIRRGECFGFLGPNGAGKTTVMRILCCFIMPTAGEVKVFGFDVIKDQSLIKARIGVMPQDENLDPDLSALENLIVYGRYFNIPKKKRTAIAAELIFFADLAGRENENIKNLSGGMKRSLLLARSIVNDPELLVLDEPTTGLDPYSRQTVWGKLGDMQAKGKTLILTTHYMEEAQRLCDRVAIMDRGKIIAIDSPKELMAQYGGNLEQVYLRLTGRQLEG